MFKFRPRAFFLILDANLNHLGATHTLDTRPFPIQVGEDLVAVAHVECEEGHGVSSSGKGRGACRGAGGHPKARSLLRGQGGRRVAGLGSGNAHEQSPAEVRPT